MTSEKQTFLKVLPTRWRRKPAGTDMERNYVTVTLCIRLIMRTRVQPMQSLSIFVTVQWHNSNRKFRDFVVLVDLLDSVGNNVRPYFRNMHPNFTKFSVHATYIQPGSGGIAID